jgi:hypothetical protein
VKKLKKKKTTTKEIIGAKSNMMQGTEETIGAVERKITGLLIIGLPVAMVIALAAGIPDSGNLLWFKIYALFLGCYSLWIFGYEYYVFHRLHELKSRPIDTLLVAGISISLLQFSKKADDFLVCLGSLASFSLFLVLWEVYTMYKGYRLYFGRPLTKKESCIAHWKEYRYWLILDGSLLLSITAAWHYHEYLERTVSADSVLYLIVLFGFVVGIINIYRYAILAARIRQLLCSESQVSENIA